MDRDVLKLAEERTGLLLDDMVIRTLQDARQTANPALRQEALEWLWLCCPDIAEQLALPAAHAAPEQAAAD